MQPAHTAHRHPSEGLWVHGASLLGYCSSCSPRSPTPLESPRGSPVYSLHFTTGGKRGPALHCTLVHWPQGAFWVCVQAWTVPSWLSLLAGSPVLKPHSPQVHAGSPAWTSLPAPRPLSWPLPTMASGRPPSQHVLCCPIGYHFTKQMQNKLLRTFQMALQSCNPQALGGMPYGQPWVEGSQNARRICHQFTESR